MSYVALYRKWRPQSFDEVVEQENIVTILKNTVIKNRIGHAYLFSGTRGTGKTSLAKIFARAINCQEPIDGSPCNKCKICQGILSGQILDVSEIDAASNNGVDNIRAIIDEANYVPAMAKYRVYIIDEAHMLSAGAFNALLKTLEEPPKAVVFILATTEAHKLPITILSRCQRYDFKRISRKGIIKRLEEICKDLKIEYDANALNFIAQKADGALRDAISLLDQSIAAYNKVSLETARESAGSVERLLVEEFAQELLLQDGSQILLLSDKIFADGRDPSNFIAELLNLFRSMLIILNVREVGDLLYEEEEELARLKKLSSITYTKEISYIIRELSKLDNNLKWSVQRKIIFEAGMLSLCDRITDKEDDLSQRISFLEKELADLKNEGLKYKAILPPIINDTAEEKKEEIILVDDIREKEEEQVGHLPIEELDWMDFIKSLGAQHSKSLSALIEAHSRGFLLGDELLIVFSNEGLMKNVMQKEAKAQLDQAASSALSRPIKVRIMLENDFYKLEKEEEKIENKRDNDFLEAISTLKDLSERDGFEFKNIE